MTPISQDEGKNLYIGINGKNYAKNLDKHNILLSAEWCCREPYLRICDRIKLVNFKWYCWNFCSYIIVTVHKSYQRTLKNYEKKKQSWVQIAILRYIVVKFG